MKVTVIPIVIVALGPIPKGLVRGLTEFEIGRLAETIQTTEYWEEFWRPEETCYHSDSRERSSTKAGVKNS